MRYRFVTFVSVLPPFVMDKEPMNQEKKESLPDQKALERALDKKSFTIREVWIISTTVVTAAIGLAVAVIHKDAEIKIEMVAIKSTVEKMKEIQDLRNEQLGNELSDIKKDVENLQNTVFKPK